MIIDFHTHTFPDKIAEKTIKYLSEKGNVKPHRDGTVSSLPVSMKKAGIDLSVVLPVATSAKQVETINNVSIENNGKNGLIFAGCIHPDCENIPEILDKIKKAGLFGIKIHPDYQATYFDDEKYINIMYEAAKRDLITVTHAGFDIGFPDAIHCTPDRVLTVLDKLKGIIENKLVLAHLGACDAPDEVLNKLCGKEIYFDTSFVLDRYPEKAKKIILSHPADKILFATDSPWADQKQYVDIIKSFNLTKSQENSIFCENAKKLLNLTV